MEEFHRAHERVFAVRDEVSIVEFLNWKGRVTVHLKRPAARGGAGVRRRGIPRTRRLVSFGGRRIETPIYREDDVKVGAAIHGPAVIEMPTTTIVVYPNMNVTYSDSGNFVFNDAPVANIAKVASR